MLIVQSSKANKYIFSNSIGDWGIDLLCGDLLNSGLTTIFIALVHNWVKIISEAALLTILILMLFCMLPTKFSDQNKYRIRKAKLESAYFFMLKYFKMTVWLVSV